MSDRAVKLTQAIIDNSKPIVESLLKDASVGAWISDHVPKTALNNHGLVDAIEWTTALHRASVRSPARVMEVLVEAGASVHSVNSEGDTALIAACMSNIDIMEKINVLIGYDKELINASDSKQVTCLHTAAQLGLVEVSTLLLQHGADIHARSFQGVTAFHMAALCNQVGVMRLLLEHGSEIDTRADNNMPVHSAALAGACDALMFLFDRGVDIHAPGDLNNSPLHYAALNGHLHCVNELMRRGAQVDLRDETGLTPLHFASMMGHARCINLLIEEHEADVNAQSNSGMTPLHGAATGGHLNAVKALTSHHNCNIDIALEDGDTVSDLAREAGHQHIEAFLTQLHLTKPLQREMSALRREVAAGKQRDDVTQGLGAMSITDDSKQSALDLKAGVQKNMPWLLTALVPMQHLDFLFSRQAITLDEYEVIRAERGNEGRLRELILTLLRKPDPSWAPIFLQSLQQYSPESAEKLLANPSRDEGPSLPAVPNASRGPRKKTSKSKTKRSTRGRPK